MKNTILGNNIKYLRKQRKLSQRALAEEIGLKRNNIASYEAGVVEPRVVTFIQLADYFGISPEILLSQNLVDSGDVKPSASASPTVSQLATLKKRDEELSEIIEELRKAYLNDVKRDQRNPRAEQLLAALNQLLKSNRDMIAKLGNYSDR